MQLLQFKNWFFNELNNIYPTTEIQSFFNLLINFKLNMSRADIALQFDYEISKKDLDFLKNGLKELKNQKPIQYIIGKTEFYGLPFYVNKHVLIPRPETEELINWILEDLTAKNLQSDLNILDIGTGSGCIAISLAKNLPNSKVFALDISSNALNTAKQNALLNNVNINFVEANILTTNNLNQTFDIIVSNPPYVREIEKQQMHKNVLNNEPHIALFVENENPLIFYDKIADFSKKHLSKNGKLYVEINQYLGLETLELLRLKQFKKQTLKKDIFNNHRMIKATV